MSKKNTHTYTKTALPIWFVFYNSIIKSHTRVSSQSKFESGLVSQHYGQLIGKTYLSLKLVCQQYEYWQHKHFFVRLTNLVIVIKFMMINISSI